MPENFQPPHRPLSHLRHCMDESSLYSYVPLEMWAGGQAEWSSLVRQEALGRDELETQADPSSSKSMLVTFGFAVVLLCLSAATLIWNAGKLTEAVVQVSENSVQELANP